MAERTAPSPRSAIDDVRQQRITTIHSDDGWLAGSVADVARRRRGRVPRMLADCAGLPSGMVHRGMKLQEIVGQADQRPFLLHADQTAPQELPKAARMFDLS